MTLAVAACFPWGRFKALRESPPGGVTMDQGMILWAVVVTLGWPLAWAVSAAIGIDLSRNWAVFGSSGALAFQLVTGLTLAYLLRQPARAPAPVPARGSSV